MRLERICVLSLVVSTSSTKIMYIDEDFSLYRLDFEIRNDINIKVAENKMEYVIYTCIK